MTSPSIVLDRLQCFLSEAMRTERLVLARSARDGRVDSQENERQVSQALEYFALSSEWFAEQSLRLEISPSRHWYDFAVTGPDGLFLPVNVKVSALRTADNISSKEGVFYALTGVLPNAVSIKNWESFCRQLSHRLGMNPDADYYFMVVSKQLPAEVFWTSLKHITELVPNGNNPPFQCNWAKNRERVARSADDAQKYILGVLRETFRLRAEALKSFDSHLAKFA